MIKDSFHLMVTSQTGLNNMNIIFALILSYYLDHLLFKFDLIQ
jgi:hypothetical protein